MNFCKLQNKFYLKLFKFDKNHYKKNKIFKKLSENN